MHFVCYYYYRYSALGPVWAETRAQSGDWYVTGTLHPGQILRGSLPLFSPILFDGEKIPFDASIVIYVNNINIPPIMIINRIYEHQNLLSL